MNPLAEKWQWPSDHLPIGASVERVGVEGTLRIISWNVLNTLWVHCISSDSQGLDGSDITKQNIQARSHLTVREERVAILVMELMRNCDILCLQECSLEMIEVINRGMDHTFGEGAIGRHTTAGEYSDFGVIYYREERCHKPTSSTSNQYISCGRDHYLHSLYFPHAIVPILVFNTHWNVHNEALKLGEKINCFLPREVDYPVVLCGDMSQKESVVLKGLNILRPGLFAAVNIPYFTSVNCDRVPVDHDHICYLNGWTRCPEEDLIRCPVEVKEEQDELPPTRFHIHAMQASQFCAELEALVTRLFFKIEVLLPITAEEGPLPALPASDQQEAGQQSHTTAVSSSQGHGHVSK